MRLASLAISDQDCATLSVLLNATALHFVLDEK